jgi:hypothetical protein
MPSTPWKTDDGYGVIVESVPDGAEGNVMIRLPNGNGFYDWDASIAKALAEGWGVTGTLDELAPLTVKQIAINAVRQDYDYVMQWCEGSIWYELIFVDLLDVWGNVVGGCGGDPMLVTWRCIGGVESESSEDYFVQLANELADDIIEGLPDSDRTTTLTITLK